MQVLAALPQDAAGLARAAALLTEHALQRAADERAAEAAELREALRDRDGQIAEVQQRADTLHGEHTALAQDLMAAHEQCEALAGQKAALVATVKQLADKVRALCGPTVLRLRTSPAPRPSRAPWRRRTVPCGPMHAGPCQHRRQDAVRACTRC